MLVIAMTAGVVTYLVYVSIPSLNSTHHITNKIAEALQPLLLFLMLFLSFCKVNPRALKPARWQLKLLIIQFVGMLVFACPLLFRLTSTHTTISYICEAGLLCMICPTATAAVVVTHKLGGRIGNVISYTFVINLFTSLLFPALISHLYSSTQHTFLISFLMILGKIFPILILPLITAFIVRYLFPSLLLWLQQKTEWAFYLWSVSLFICMAMTTHSIVSSHEHLFTYLCIALTSLFCCALQFYLGRHIGKRHGDPVSAAQTLGQKNTAFAIWLAYTFMNPLITLAGGFYIIWQNSFNSWQLAKHFNKN